MEPSVTIAPRLPGDHLPGEGAAAMHRAVVVHLPHAVVRRHVHVHDALGVRDQSRRGDQDARRSLLLLDLRRHGVDRLGIRYVASIEARRITDGPGNGFAARRVHIDDRNVVAIGREPAGRGLADAAGSAGDDCNAWTGHARFPRLSVERFLAPGRRGQLADRKYSAGLFFIL